MGNNKIEILLANAIIVYMKNTLINIYSAIKEVFNKYLKPILSFCKKYFEIVCQFCRTLLDNYGFLLFGVLLIGIAILVRYAVFPYISWDLHSFIFNWIKGFRNDGFEYLGHYGGDYPPAYMLILFFISLFPAGNNIYNYGRSDISAPLNDIFLVKSVSILFDILLAVGVLLLVYKISKKNKMVSFIAFAVVLFLPTAILNSSFWGQIDSIYVTFVIYALVLILYGKQRVGFFIFGLSIAVKLQGIFFLPVIGVLWLNKKVKLRYLFYSFCAMLLTFIPCYAAGGSFMFPFMKYLTLMTEYDKLNYNSGSLYAFLENATFFNANTSNNYKIISTSGLLLAAAILLSTMFILYKKNIKMTEENIIKISALFAMLAPFVLPFMHERYFFLGDIFIIVFAVIRPRKSYLAVLEQGASLITISIYLFGAYFISTIGASNTKIAAVLNLFVIVMLFYDIFKKENVAQIEVINNEKNSEKEEQI